MLMEMLKKKDLRSQTIASSNKFFLSGQLVTSPVKVSKKNGDNLYCRKLDLIDLPFFPRICLPSISEPAKQC